MKFIAFDFQLATNLANTHDDVLIPVFVSLVSTTLLNLNRCTYEHLWSRKVAAKTM